MWNLIVLVPDHCLLSTLLSKTWKLALILHIMGKTTEPGEFQSLNLDSQKCQEPNWAALSESFH